MILADYFLQQNNASSKGLKIYLALIRNYETAPDNEGTTTDACAGAVISRTRRTEQMKSIRLVWNPDFSFQAIHLVLFNNLKTSLASFMFMMGGTQNRPLPTVFVGLVDIKDRYHMILRNLILVKRYPQAPFVTVFKMHIYPFFFFALLKPKQ